jgi:hypothetical protein
MHDPKLLEGVSHSPTCACKECWNKNHLKPEPTLYGVYDSFREAINSWCVQFVPENAFIYADGAVLEFKYTQPANTFCDYIKSRMPDRYTGIAISQWSWKVALIDVASIGASDDSN